MYWSRLPRQCLVYWFPALPVEYLDSNWERVGNAPEPVYGICLSGSLWRSADQLHSCYWVSSGRFISCCFHCFASRVLLLERATPGLPPRSRPGARLPSPAGADLQPPHHGCVLPGELLGCKLQWRDYPLKHHRDLASLFQGGWLEEGSFLPFLHQHTDDFTQQLHVHLLMLPKMWYKAVPQLYNIYIIYIYYIYVYMCVYI